MSVSHHEKAAVASITLPTRLRRSIGVIYRFARTADGFADEGALEPADRRARLDDYCEQLHRVQWDSRPRTPLFEALNSVVREYGLPLQPSFDLLDAFYQDAVNSRHVDFAEILYHGRQSANFVGSQK